jgi:polysaccharide biosynthesis PFTS motif protein
VNILNSFFKTKKNNLEFAIDKENMILLQKKFEIKNVENEIKKYNKNVRTYENNSKLINSFQHINLIFYYLFYPIYSLFFFKLKKKSKKIKIALRTYNSGIRLNKNDLRLDWFVEKNKYREQTCFFYEDELDYDFRKQIIKNNYDSIETFYRKPYYFLKAKHILNFYPNLISKILINFFHFIFFDFENKKVMINAIKNYILWSNITSLFDIKIFFSYHDYSINGIYRNIILHSKNCKTISFKHSHSELVHDEKHYFNSAFANNYFSKEYHWSKLGIKNAKRNLSRSVNLHNTLPFCRLINQKVRKINTNKKFIYISCFSSQLGTSYSFNNPNEHLLFLKYMITLLKANKDIAILFKPKYKTEFLKEFYPKHYYLIKELIKTKRFSINKKIKAVDLIKQSSFSISMSFASPTIEALALLKPSFYVSFQNSFKNNSFRNMKYFYVNGFGPSIKNFNLWKNYLKKNKIKDKLLKKYFNQIFGNKYLSYQEIHADLSKYLD